MTCKLVTYSTSAYDFLGNNTKVLESVNMILTDLTLPQLLEHLYTHREPGLRVCILNLEDLTETSARAVEQGSMPVETLWWNEYYA